MALKLITPASVPAVSLAEAKMHLRVDVADEDSLITGFIHAAISAAEQQTGRALMPQTWELTLDAFPEAFELTRVPAVSVTSLKYWDEMGAQQTLSSDQYSLDNADDYGSAFVVPAYNSAWPASRGQINAVAVRYVAGYADAAAVPEAIKSWIKVMVSTMFENRNAEQIDRGQLLSLGYVDGLLAPYKVWKL